MRTTTCQTRTCRATVPLRDGKDGPYWQCPYCGASGLFGDDPILEEMADPLDLDAQPGTQGFPF